MSDDTPTQRFDAADDESRTELLSTSTTEADEPDEAAVAEAGTSRRRRIVILAVAGALLLVAIIVAVSIALSQQTPEVAPVPTSTSEGSSVPPPPLGPDGDSETGNDSDGDAPSTGPAAIASFFAWDDVVDCSGHDAVPVAFVWETAGSRVWFGVGTENAMENPYDDFPTSHTLEIDYECGQPSESQVYSITVEAADGTTASASIRITELEFVVP